MSRSPFFAAVQGSAVLLAAGVLPNDDAAATIRNVVDHALRAATPSSR